MFAGGSRRFVADHRGAGGQIEVLSADPKTALFTDPAVRRRAGAFFADQIDKIHRRTDRLFAVLMVLQWIGGIVAACVVSPRTWNGASSAVHPHLTAAVFLGGLIASLPLALVFLKPGAAITR